MALSLDHKKHPGLLLPHATVIQFDKPKPLPQIFNGNNSNPCPINFHKHIGQPIESILDFHGLGFVEGGVETILEHLIGVGFPLD